MEVSYYPGCSLHGMAGEYDESIRAVCRTLDISLAELDDWNCCGASSAHFVDDELAVSLPARNMMIAEREGRSAEEVLYDYMLRDEGRELLLMPTTTHLPDHHWSGMDTETYSQLYVLVLFQVWIEHCGNGLDNT